MRSGGSSKEDAEMSKRERRESQPQRRRERREDPFKWTLCVLCVSAVYSLSALSGCKKAIKVDTREAQDIPREVALSKLREVLPTAESVSCTQPKESYKRAEIRDWGVGAEMVVIQPASGMPLTFGYVDIASTRLEKSGKNFYVRVFTTLQKEKNREHFSFAWRSQESAQQVVELLEALRRKQ
jgi:hypothetical protein